MPPAVTVVARRMTTIRCAAAVTLTAGALGAGTAPAHASSTEPVGRWDREYLAGTVQGARFEIAAGHVAQRHAQTASAKALADRFVSDHSAELKQVLALARQLGVKTPAGLSTAQRHEISQFSQHTGRAFDRAYVRVERTDHVQDIKDNDAEVAEGTTASVKAFAQRFLPMYRTHLELCRAAASRLKVG
jgi:putative membrane protein